jgi:hypothetical protein
MSANSCRSGIPLGLLFRQTFEHPADEPSQGGRGGNYRDPRGAAREAAGEKTEEDEKHET